MANDDKLRYFLKRVSADLEEAHERLREHEARDVEPIAIVGLGCRFPGNARSAEELWELVAAGADVMSPYPDDRGWDLDGISPPAPADVEAPVARVGGFVYDATDFDPG